MSNGFDQTTGIHNAQNDEWKRGMGIHSQLLGNVWLLWPTQLASFKGAHGRGYPYLAHVLPGLTYDTGNLAIGPRSYNTASNPPEPAMTPQERQAMNLDTSIKTGNGKGTTQPGMIVESWPVVVILGVLAVVVLSVGIHLSTGGTLNIGGR